MANQELELIHLFYAFIGGVLPALVWLWFWLKEDKKNPEPNKMIALTFVIGGLSVFLAFWLQSIGTNLLSQNPKNLIAEANLSWVFFLFSFPFFVLMAFAEELAKFIAVWFTALKSRFNDEPIDAMVYMITGALGFVAFENSLFILSSILQDDHHLNFIATGNLRFIGASVVHIVSSAIIGAAISLSYYSKDKIKVLNLTLGFILAVLLHALFNFLIITEIEIGILGIFALWWVIAIVVMLMFEKVKNSEKLNFNK